MPRCLRRGDSLPIIRLRRWERGACHESAPGFAPGISLKPRRLKPRAAKSAKLAFAD